MNPLQQIRAHRIKALRDGTPEPVAFGFWDDPELLTDGAGDVFHIWFNDLIDDWYGISSAMIVEALLNADGRDVLVHLNSPGGMVFEGMAIHSAFKQYAGKVTMRVEGLAASAASFVMLAGDEVIIEPNAMVMIHDAWDLTMGDEAEHLKAAEVLGKVSGSIASMYAAKSSGDAEEWRARMRGETWYVGAEAVEAGLADSVTDTDTNEETSAVAASAAGARAQRWGGIFAKTPKRTGGHLNLAPGECAHGGRAAECGKPGGHGTKPPLIDTAALATEVARQKTAPVVTLPETPAWWAKLQSGLKGVQQ